MSRLFQKSGRGYHQVLEYGANLMRKTTLLLTVLCSVLFPTRIFGQGSQNPAVIAVDAAHPGASHLPIDVRRLLRRHQLRRRRRTLSRTGQEPLLRISRPDGRLARSDGVKRLEDRQTPRASSTFHAEDPLNQTNPHYLRVRDYEPGYAFYNTGFRGMGVESGAEYRFSAYVRTQWDPTPFAPPSPMRTATMIGSGKLEGFDHIGSNTKPSSERRQPRSMRG